MTIDAEIRDQTRAAYVSSLVSRNVRVNGHRTSLRLEPEMWELLADIAAREDSTISRICTRIDEVRGSAGTLTAAIRVWIAAYYKAAATEEGHAKAGHGRARARAQEQEEAA